LSPASALHQQVGLGLRLIKRLKLFNYQRFEMSTNEFKTKTTPSTSPPVTVATAVHLLHRAGQCADELFSLNSTTGSMTPRQFAVLKAIASSTEPSQTTLVEMTGIDRSTVADIVRRLVERGLVQRRKTRRDARMYALRLTVKGVAALRATEPAAQTTDDKLLASLGAAEREVFVQALAKIVANIGPISSARVTR
jgi:DNA-binding MarR family transcriptional regulator